MNTPLLMKFKSQHRTDRERKETCVPPGADVAQTPAAGSLRHCFWRKQKAISQASNAAVGEGGGRLGPVWEPDHRIRGIPNAEHDSRASSSRFPPSGKSVAVLVAACRH